MPVSLFIRVFTWCMSGSSHSLPESPSYHDVASDDDSPSSEDVDVHEDHNDSDEDESRWVMMLKLVALDKLKKYENILSRFEADDNEEEKEREDENENDIQSQIVARIDAIHRRIRYLETCWAGQQRQGLVFLREIEDELEDLRENDYLYSSWDVYEDDDSDNDVGGGDGNKGAPPAAESAVAALKNIQIELEEEALLCAVCQDLVNVGETAKELCCGHRFHGDCVVSWLASRNTCPLCRFESPTNKCDHV